MLRLACPHVSDGILGSKTPHARQRRTRAFTEICVMMNSSLLAPRLSLQTRKAASNRRVRNTHHLRFRSFLSGHLEGRRAGSQAASSVKTCGSFFSESVGSSQLPPRSHWCDCSVWIHCYTRSYKGAVRPAQTNLRTANGARIDWRMHALSVRPSQKRCKWVRTALMQIFCFYGSVVRTLMQTVVAYYQVLLPIKQANSLYAARKRNGFKRCEVALM